MRQPPAHACGSRRLLAWSAVLVAAACTLVPASSAVAHDALIGSDPADGATVDAAPSQVVLTFAAEQAGVGAEVVVTGPDGGAWSDGAAVTSGTTVTQPLVDGMPDGAYTVAWRSVAQDGHPVTGTFGFVLDAPDTEPAAPEPTASAAAEPTRPSDASDTEDTADSVPADDADDAAATSGWTAWHTAAAVVVAALAALAIVLVRRSRRGEVGRE